MPRVGEQIPTYRYCADYTRTQGNVAFELASVYGLRPHPWQRSILDDWLAMDDYGTLINSTCLLPVSRQNGKALSLDTEIPTPDGWKRMNDIHVGDYVFGQDGKPSRVTLESEIFHKPMYRVTFDDGATVDASEDHVWTVQTHGSMQTCSRVSKTEPRTYRRKHEYHGDGWYELTTKDMIGNYSTQRHDGRIEYRYRIPMNDAVEYPERVLPVHPYLLGAWLGDGTSKSANITINESEISEMERIFAECGETLTRLRTKDRAPCFRIGRKTEGRHDDGSFFKRLKSLGVIGNKHIPEQYMLASVEQRWALLQGLMDTDGYCSKAGQCEFTQKRRELCEQVIELCASLGIKARMHEKQATCNGKYAGVVYRVMFFTDSSRPCFRMERKRLRLKDSVAKRTTYKAIANIERIADVPSKCIAIDNDSHLYLAGRQYTATHNTGVVDPRETWGLIIRGERILHTAQEYQTSRVGFDRLRAKFGNKKNDPDAKYPELNRLVEKYTTSANQMILDLKNGGHIEFRTRGSSGDVGRGGTFDLVVVDEAQSYTEEQDAALSPLNSAAPLGSPQTILMGTVPDPARPYKGVVFSRLRNFAHNDPYEGLCIHEWGATEVGDPLDEDRWYEFNPSLGYQLLISALRKDARCMSPETFAREHLGWWGAATLAAHPISADDWARCRVESAPDDGNVIYAVKFDPDARMGAIAVCIDNGVDVPHVELASEVSCRGGIGRFVETLLGISDYAESIIIDGQSNARTLENALLDAGVPDDMIVRPNTGQAVEAYTGFVNATRSRAVTHITDESTDESVCECNRRRIGTAGGYGFASNDRANATLVDALAFAYWGAMLKRREPEEELRLNL